MDRIEEIKHRIIPAEMVELHEERTGVFIELVDQEIDECWDRFIENRNKAMHPRVLRTGDETTKLSHILNDMRQQVAELRELIERSSLKAVIREWLTHVESPEKYASFMNDFYKRGIIPKTFADGQPFTVGAFKRLNTRPAIDYIRSRTDLSEVVRWDMQMCYESLFDHLDEITYRWVPEEASSLLSEYTMTPEAADQALSLQEWQAFMNALSDLNPRDELIARFIIQGTLRVSEALGLTIDQIEFFGGIINLKRKKQTIEIYYDFGFISELRDYITSTMSVRKGSPLVFLTRNGKAVTRSRLNHSFAQASLKANIKKVTPECLRSTWVMLKQQGWKESEIMRSKKLRAFDKED